MRSRLIRNLDRACLAILVALTLIGGVWTATDFVTQKRRFQQEAARRIEEQKDLEKADANLAALRQASSQVRQEMAGLNKRVPQNTDMGSLIQELNIQMRERKLALTTLQPQPEVKEDLFKRTPIRLLFQGTFLQIYQFFYDVERMDRLLAPEKITITGLEADRVCQVDLTLQIIERNTALSGG